MDSDPDRPHVLPRPSPQREAAALLDGRGLLVVSGHRLVLTLLEAAVGSGGSWLRSGTGERDGLMLLALGRPDGLLVVEPLEQGNAIALVRQVKRLHPDLPTLLVLRHDTPAQLRAALAAGCNGVCLERRLELTELVKAGRAVLNGGSYLDPFGFRLLHQALVPLPHQREVRLTERERQVLERMARGYRNREIAARLHLSVETVRSHVRSLLRKLNARDRAQASAIAVAMGLVRYGTEP